MLCGTFKPDRNPNADFGKRDRMQKRQGALRPMALV
jgi:hypothetical protein